MVSSSNFRVEKDKRNDFKVTEHKKPELCMGGAFTGSHRCTISAATVRDHHPEGEEGKESPGGSTVGEGCMCLDDVT